MTSIVQRALSTSATTEANDIGGGVTFHETTITTKRTGIIIGAPIVDGYAPNIGGRMRWLPIEVVITDVLRRQDALHDEDAYQLAERYVELSGPPVRKSDNQPMTHRTGAVVSWRFAQYEPGEQRIPEDFPDWLANVAFSPDFADAVPSLAMAPWNGA